MHPQHTSDRTMSDRAILHVDMDAFYASIEIRDDPTLRGKPVIVGGLPESRGVVAAASYEVRKYGIHSAMSSYRARKLCPHAIFVPGRMSHYADVSKQIFAILRSYTPLVEPLSIDEAFLDVSGSRNLFGTAVDIGRAIKKRIRTETELTASVGVAPNKFLAKLASDLEKPDGLVVVKADRAAALLADLPVGKIWGIGKVAQKSLETIGVRTVREMLDCPRERLNGVFGSNTGRLLELARGIDERPVVVGEAAKSIGAETTFAKDISDEADLRIYLTTLMARVARRLRKSGYRTQTVQLKARYADFKTVTRAVTLPEPTTSTEVLQNAVRNLFEYRLGRKGRALRLIGTSVSNLTSPVGSEPMLFQDEKLERQGKLDTVVDALQDKYGSKTIWRGPQRMADDVSRFTRKETVSDSEED
ncbi:MAG: DNA polymerase IV [bacterium]|nr:DNA polymerase IV [bacterium]